MLTKEKLLAIMPGVGARADVYIDPINKTAERFQINTRRRLAEFLAQMLHESGGLQFTRESMNYTPQALMATFNTPARTRFTSADAIRYGRTDAHKADEVMIASMAYANRMGNGAVETREGWLYRGGGPGQLTGKTNYAKCGAALGIDLLSHPERIEQPEVGTLAFAWYWTEGNSPGLDLNLVADAGDIDKISDVVNLGRPTPLFGDALGFDKRKRLRDRCLEVLA